MSGINQKLTIGLFGYGCVGQGLHDVLNQTRGLDAEIRKIAVRDRSKPRRVAASLITYDPADILQDPDIQVVVELIDDADAAFEIVSTALRNGKAVVSANKKMIAEHLPELLELQRLTGQPFLYEGAVCASIPILRNLEEYYDNDLLRSVQGIINGSTNYILTRMFREGMPFDEALAKAQALGFAESNPRLDTEGFDASYKLSILLFHAFGALVDPRAILRCGIQKLGILENRYAVEKQFKLKLLAFAREYEGQLYSYILPSFVPRDHALYLTDEQYNGVQLETAFSETQFFLGKGAGAFPTGSAVLSDLSALRYNYKYACRKYHSGAAPVLSDQFSLLVFLRYDESSPIDTARFESVREQFHSAEGCYLIGRISVTALRESGWLEAPGFSVIVMPEGWSLPAANTEVRYAEELVELESVMG